MKVLVIGATGGTGRHAVTHLLKEGHTVTAFARNPAAVTMQHERLELAQGDALDQAALERAMQGQDAVLSLFGPRTLRKTDVQERYMRALVAAMTRTGVKRLVNLSACTAGDSKAGLPLLMRWIFLPLIFKHVIADKDRGEKLLFASPIDYVNVRPGRLLDKPAQGGVKASLSFGGLQLRMNREDLALFMIAQLQNSDWVCQSPLIGY
jgi:uncharacterized protein YbjT (DUF2867 family)